MMSPTTSYLNDMLLASSCADKGMVWRDLSKLEE